MFITIQDTSFARTRTEQSVPLPLPWHELLIGKPCDNYVLTGRSAHDKSFAIQSEPFAMQIPDACQRNVVTAPADGELIALDQPYTIQWDANQLFFYMKDGPAHEGQVVPVERVQVMLIGTHYVAEGEDCRHGHYDEVDSACIEATFLTPPTGTSNDGFFTFDFSTERDGHDEKLCWNGTWWDGRYDHIQVRLTAQDHSPITVASRGRSYLSTNTLGSITSQPWCLEDASDELDVVPTSGIPIYQSKTDTDKVSGDPSEGDDRRRLTSASLSITGSLGMEANFDSVDLWYAGRGSSARLEIDSDDSAHPPDRPR